MKDLIILIGASLALVATVFWLTLSVGVVRENPCFYGCPMEVIYEYGK